VKLRTLQLENQIKSGEQQESRSPVLMLFSIFTVDLQIYCCSLALILFSSLTVVLQLYCCSQRTTVKLENSSKAEEQQQG
jgi:hypothetical protein